MADWAVWVTAAEPALGWPEQSILSAYRTMRGTVIEATLDGDALAVALCGLTRPWESTAAELLARITPAGRAPRGWPESPRAMSAALRRLAPGLRRLGIEVSTHKEAGTGGRRLIAITTQENGPDEPSRPSQPSQDLDSVGDFGDGQGDDKRSVASPDQAHVRDGCDRCDGCDDSGPVFSTEDTDHAGLF